MRFSGFRLYSIHAAAIIGFLIAIFVNPSFSQSPPATERQVDQKPSATLPPRVSQELAFHLRLEEKKKKIGLLTSWLTFPMPSCNFDGRLCGAVNRDGTIAVAPVFNWVSSFMEGRALVRQGELYGYVDESGRLIARPQFSTVDTFVQGLAQIDVDGRSGAIDRDGQVILWPRFGFVVPFTANSFWATEEREIHKGDIGNRRFLFDQPIYYVNGRSETYVMPKGKWGLVDRSGNWFRRPEFSAVRYFDNKASGFMWAKTGANWGLVRPDLSWRIEPKFEEVRTLEDGMAAIQLNGRWGYVDGTGRIVIEPRFDEAGPFTGPYAPVRVDKLFGLIDRKGAWILEPKYDLIYKGGIFIPIGWWNIKLGEKYGVLDDALNVFLEPQFEQEPFFCLDGRTILGWVDKRPDDLWHLYSRDGKLIRARRPGEATGCTQ